MRAYLVSLAIGLLLLGCTTRPPKPSGSSRNVGQEIDPEVAIRDLGGRITHDEADPRKPVIGVDFHSNSKVQDNDLQYLAGLPKLRTLDLRETGVSDSGLTFLLSLGELQEVDLRDTKVTESGAKKLQEALPKLKITR